LCCRCIVTNEFLKKKKSREAKLTVVSRTDDNRSHTPSVLFPQTSYNYWLLDGSNLNLACAASGYPLPLITWSFIPRYIGKELKKQTYMLLSVGQHLINLIVFMFSANVTQPRILFNSTIGIAILSLTNVNVSNAGVYLCSSKNFITNDLEVQVGMIELMKYIKDI